MKKLLLSIALFTSMFVSAQNMTPVTRAEFNDINLKLEKVERFGKQHRLGNQVKMVGVLTTVSGILVLQRDYAIQNRLRNWILPNFFPSGSGNTKLNRLGKSLTFAGLGITTIGVTINISSYRHLKFSPRKRLSISLK